MSDAPTGGREKVAFDLYLGLKEVLGDLRDGASVAKSVERHLALFVQCRNAVNGAAIDASKLT